MSEVQSSVNNLGEQKRAWLSAMFGIAFPSAKDGDAAGEVERILDHRLHTVLVDLKLLPQPDHALVEQARQIRERLAAHDWRAAATLLEALEGAIARAKGAARQAEAAAVSEGVAEYRGLQLRWRAAEAATVERLKRLSTLVLQDPEMQADPLYPEVQEAARDLTDVLPAFGSKLADLLDALDEPARAAKPVDDLVDEALDVIDEYRAVLEAADELGELEQFAAEEYGGFTLSGELGLALDEIEAALGR